MSIAIINSSTLVSDTDGQLIVQGLNMLLPSFCKDWLLAPQQAIYIGKGKQTNIPIKVYLLDNSDIEDVLGYHDISSNIPYGKCFVKTLLDDGGVILFGKNVPTLAQVVSHEVFELLFDPYINLWWDIGDGRTLFASEVCDPVQSNVILVNITVTPMKKIFNNTTKKFINIPAVTQQIAFSDWILPAWSQRQNKKGPYNKLNTLKAPFTLDKGGYVIQITSGQFGQVTSMNFGENVTEHEKEVYSAHKRLVKRMI
jgi:hypothetical protein